MEKLKTGGEDFKNRVGLHCREGAELGTPRHRRRVTCLAMRSRGLLAWFPALSAQGSHVTVSGDTPPPPRERGEGFALRRAAWRLGPLLNVAAGRGATATPALGGWGLGTPTGFGRGEFWEGASEAHALEQRKAAGVFPLGGLSVVASGACAAAWGSGPRKLPS